MILKKKLLEKKKKKRLGTWFKASRSDSSQWCFKIFPAPITIFPSASTKKFGERLGFTAGSAWGPRHLKTVVKTLKKKKNSRDEILSVPPLYPALLIAKYHTNKILFAHYIISQHFKILTIKTKQKNMSSYRTGSMLT